MCDSFTVLLWSLKQSQLGLVYKIDVAFTQEYRLVNSLQNLQPFMWYNMQELKIDSRRRTLRSFWWSQSLLNFVESRIPLRLYDSLMERKCGLLQGGCLPSRLSAGLRLRRRKNKLNGASWIHLDISWQNMKLSIKNSPCRGMLLEQRERRKPVKVSRPQSLYHVQRCWFPSWRHSNQPNKVQSAKACKKTVVQSIDLQIMHACVVLRRKRWNERL